MQRGGGGGKKRRAKDPSASGKWRRPRRGEASKATDATTAETSTPTSAGSAPAIAAAPTGTEPPAQSVLRERGRSVQVAVDLRRCGHLDPRFVMAVAFDLGDAVTRAQTIRVRLDDGRSPPEAYGDLAWQRTSAWWSAEMPKWRAWDLAHEVGGALSLA